VPIIAAHPRSIDGGKAEIAAEAKRQRRAGYQLAEDVRYHERSAAERVNARLKDEFGGRHVRVRGHAKVYCQLMFGVLALAVDQLVQARFIPRSSRRRRSAYARRIRPMGVEEERKAHRWYCDRRRGGANYLELPMVR